MSEPDGWFDSLAGMIGSEKVLDLFGELQATGQTQFGAEFGLSEEEVTSIHAYTLADQFDGQTCFKKVNSALRLGKAADIEPFLSVMIEGLLKLPPFEGPVSRMTDLPPPYSAMSPGDVFFDNAFVSTSSVIDPAKRMFFGIDHLTLLSLTGREISFLSAAPAEHEVLFLPGTKFKLSSIRRNAKSGYSLIADEEDG